MILLWYILFIFYHLGVSTQHKYTAILVWLHFLFFTVYKFPLSIQRSDTVMCILFFQFRSFYSAQLHSNTEVMHALFFTVYKLPLSTLGTDSILLWCMLCFFAVCKFPLITIQSDTEMVYALVLQTTEIVMLQNGSVQTWSVYRPPSFVMARKTVMIIQMNATVVSTQKNKNKN